MAQDGSFPISGRNISYLLLCGGGLLAFVLLIIVPMHGSLAEQDREIAAATAQLRRQEILFPVYTDLMRRLRAEDERPLPLPEESGIGLDDMAGFVADFKKMAQANNFEVVVISPDYKSLSAHPGLLGVSAVLKGDFMDLRRLLIEIGGLAALRHLEEIQVSAAPGFKEFRLKFRLAIRAQAS